MATNSYINRLSEEYPGIEQGPLESIFDYPQTEYTRSLLEATPSLIRN
jgi:ABC-type dipeptide/oligopeptide/nickel transport system ATPase component